MKTPIDSVERITQRLPDDGSRFLLCDAVAAMQEAYERDRLDGCNENDDQLMLGAVTNTHFEIEIFRQFTGGGDHVPTQLEVSLKYPINLRCRVFREYIRYCEIVSDSTEFFSSFRSSLLYRWYASTLPNRGSCSHLLSGSAFRLRSF